MYVILDIETTGGKFNEEGITEIAIYKFDGHTVVDQFISLVNPEKPIQEFVVQLTGINNKMLRNAPKFFEVAKRIIEITKDSILVLTYVIPRLKQVEEITEEEPRTFQIEVIDSLSKYSDKELDKAIDKKLQM